jgi:hypothetical protein
MVAWRLVHGLKPNQTKHMYTEQSGVCGSTDVRISTLTSSICVSNTSHAVSCLVRFQRSSVPKQHLIVDLMGSEQTVEHGWANVQRKHKNFIVLVFRLPSCLVI